MESDLPFEILSPLVLLADGDPDDQEMFCTAMRQLYPQVRTKVFNNGPSLLNFLEAYPGSGVPAGIVIEYRLPGLSGPEVLQAIGFLARYKDVPKVIWSNVAMEHQVDECLGLGAARYFIKPDTIDKFNEFITSLYSLFLSDEGPTDSEAGQVAG